MNAYKIEFIFNGSIHHSYPKAGSVKLALAWLNRSYPNNQLILIEEI